MALSSADAAALGVRLEPLGFKPTALVTKWSVPLDGAAPWDLRQQVLEKPVSGKFAASAAKWFCVWALLGQILGLPVSGKFAAGTVRWCCMMVRHHGAYNAHQIKPAHCALSIPNT